MQDSSDPVGLPPNSQAPHPVTPQVIQPQTSPIARPVGGTDVSPLPAAAVPAPSPLPTYGYNDSQRKAREGFSVTKFITWLVIVLLVVGALLYLWLLPLVWSKAYTKKITPLFKQQSSQISEVYQSLNRPLFTGGNTSPSGDAQDYQYISGIIQIAQNNTKALAAQDHLIVLPGTGWQKSASNTYVVYQSMKQYVTNSQTFLHDYKALLTYIQQLGQIASTKLPTLINDINTINKGAQEQVFLTDLKQTTNDLQNFTQAMNALQPPADLEQFNQELMTDLNDMESALQTQESGLSSGTRSGFDTSRAVYISALHRLAQLLSSNPTAQLATNSDLHNQIVTLQAEHPLQ